MKNYHIKDGNGKEHWISRSMAVHGILRVHDGEKVYLLMEQRGPGCPDEIGKWANPTGYLDWDETLKEGLQREVYEELGLDLNTVPHIITLYGIDDLPQGRQNVTVRYLVDLELSDILPLVDNGTINTNTKSRGGEGREVSKIGFLKIYPGDEIDPEDYAFDHGELINTLVRDENRSHGE